MPRAANAQELDHGAAVEFHPRVADAGVEVLDRVLGCVSLTGPAPRSDFFRTDEPDERTSSERGRGD